MNRILLTNGMRKYLLMAALMLAGTLTAGAQNYVFYNATYGYIINNNGNPGVSTTFTNAAVWVAGNTLGTTGTSLYSYTDNTKYLNGSANNYMSLGGSQSNWQIRNNVLTYRTNRTNYTVIYYDNNLISYNTTDYPSFTPYEVTITPVGATLTGVTIETGESTLAATGEYPYTLTDGSYTNASTNYHFNNADHYYPAQTTTTETPVGTWSVSGTGASYVSVNASTGTITVNSLPTDGIKTITLSCTPSYSGTNGQAVTKEITLMPALPTAITASESSLALCIGSEATATYSFTPAEAYDNVVASSSNTSVATATRATPPTPPCAAPR